MKISETWLREWVNPPISTEQLVTQLTMAGLEVDSVTPVAGQFDKVVVAKVITAIPHPAADKLTLCTVEWGGETSLSVVCGASNVRAGLIVALALPGATLPNGMVITETKLRGELSQGMLCSAAELGLQDEASGILELPEDAPIGVQIREYMTLDDSILDLDLTPNRADCFSVLGVAREVATQNAISLFEREFTTHQPTHQEIVSVHLDEPDACPRYCGRIIRDINPHASSPLWLLERLRRAGIRPIHPVVDVTNYVMLEFGQPMHAFDRQALDGAIHVRYSSCDETVSLLDGQEVTLHNKTLVIADDVKILAIAGVMGGESSAITVDTTTLFLESAFFHPLQVAGVARQYGLCTESSQRFERGVDPLMQQRAIEYATSLILNIVGGQAGPIVLAEAKDKPFTPIVLTFNPSQVERLTGVMVSEQEMLSTLRSLGMTVDAQNKLWTVTVPSHRFDITLDVDLVEEIIRIYGYDRISTKPMVATIKVGSLNPLEQLTKQLSGDLKSRGYHEIISYSFVDPELQHVLYPDSATLTLLNPISSELSQMRVGLWSGLLASLVYNSHRQQSLIKLFESGVVFDNSNGVLKEIPSVAGLIAGEIGSLNWSEPSRKLDFYDLKGDVQALLAGLNIPPVRFVPAIHPGLHPGQSAQMVLDNQAIGWIGLLHPRLVEALDLSGDVIMFEMMLEPGLVESVPQYKKTSKFPRVRRDLSFLIDEDVLVDRIIQSVHEKVDKALLKSFDVFDVYVGGSIPAGKKSIAIALTLQDEHRTLIDEEVNQLIDSVIKKLNHDFSITLRD